MVATTCMKRPACRNTSRIAPMAPGWTVASGYAGVKPLPTARVGLGIAAVIAAPSSNGVRLTPSATRNA